MLITFTPSDLAPLLARDERLAAAVSHIGPISREGEDDIFTALVQAITGQQISGKARDAILGRLIRITGTISLPNLAQTSAEELRAAGLSLRKAGYIRALCARINSGDLDLERLRQKSDEEVIKDLTALPGIGPWTAEMILLFTLNRPDVFRISDYGIKRGLRMLYQRRELPQAELLRFKQHFSPYGSAVSFYLWAVSGGAVSGLDDPAGR